MDAVSAGVSMTRLAVEVGLLSPGRQALQEPGRGPSDDGTEDERVDHTTQEAKFEAVVDGVPYAGRITLTVEGHGLFGLCEERKV